MKPSIPGLFFVGRFLITDSISVLVIGLCRLNKTRDEKLDIITDARGRRMVTRDHYEQLRAGKLDNPEEEDQFLESETYQD